MSRIPFESVPVAESREPLVCVARYPLRAIPVYYHHGWTPEPELYLRQGVVERLLQAQDVLRAHGLAWVIYDGWRSRETQARIYEHYWQEFGAHTFWPDAAALTAKVSQFVTVPADLRKIPSHTTGGAVDLGLYDLRSGAVVDMGAEFDEFVETVADRWFEEPGRDPVIRERRKLVRTVLAQVGISSDEDEYFHKDFGNQKWAFETGAPVAQYGEVVSVCRRGNQVLAAWAEDESELSRVSRIEELARYQNLPFPPVNKPKELRQPSRLPLYDGAWRRG